MARREAARLILGVVLAGGRSSRFGSGKALAELDGQTLLARAVDQLESWCDAVVVVGRVEAPAPALPDWPRPGLGPLGGLAAALRHARANGFDSVLSIGVDSVGLPADLPALLSPGPACLGSQPVVGFWPAEAAQAIEAILEGTGSHAMLALADAVGARRVELAQPLANVNTPEDLAALKG